MTPWSEEVYLGKYKDIPQTRQPALAKITGTCDYGADLGLKLLEDTLQLALVQAKVSHATFPAGSDRWALRRTLEHARQKSPFYRQLLADLEPASLLSPADLGKIPLLDAADIVAQGRRMLCVSQSRVARIISLDCSAVRTSMTISLQSTACSITVRLSVGKIAFVVTSISSAPPAPGKPLKKFWRYSCRFRP